LKRRSAPGAAPGTLIADPTAARSTIHYWRFNRERCDEKQDCAPESLDPPQGSGDVVWVDVVGLGDTQLIQRIGERFGFHPLALEDVVNLHQRPKVEDYDNHLYLVARMAVPDQGASTEQLSVFLAPGLVLTFQQRAGDCFEPVRERIRRAKGRIRNMPADYLLYALLDAVVDGYFPVLEKYGEILEALESEIITDPKPVCIEQLHNMRRDLLALRRAIWPSRDMLGALLRGDLDFIAESTRIYLRDTHDHTFQLIDIVETYREIATGLMDAYLSSLSTKLNEVMKVLTIMATVFLPLTFITSLYGMNFDRGSPWNMPELGWRFGYAFSLGIMIAAVGGMIYYFWRKGWLGK
jgi:magnesium transporter